MDPAKAKMMTRKDTIQQIRTPEFDTFVQSHENVTKIAEGKTKQIFEIKGYPGQVLIHSKDRITAFNAVRSNEIEGKASLSNLTTCRVFQYLQTLGLKTHFIRTQSDADFVAERCAMIPLEWVARRVATGSFLKRNPSVNEGYRFNPPKLEIFYKDDENNDPQWSEETVIESGMTISGIRVGRSEVEMMKRLTRAVFELLEKAWSLQGCTLVDMKIEFGINVEGDIIVADVIDNDSWRLWPNGDRRLQLDKQFYRDLPEVTPEMLAQLKTNYETVKDKLAKFITPAQGRVVVLMGSASDMAHCEKIRTECLRWGLPVELRVSSAHKDPQTTMDIIAQYEGDGVPTVFVCVAGRSNGLGPVSAGVTTLPVINCPPVDAAWGPQDIWSSLRLPSGLGCTTVLDPASAALAAARIVGTFDHMVWGRLKVAHTDTFIALQRADRKLLEENDKSATDILKRSISYGCQVNPFEINELTTNGHAAGDESES